MENIVHKFTLIIHEYLNHAKQSIPLKTIDNSHYIITIGLNAIIHGQHKFTWFSNSQNILIQILVVLAYHSYMC